MTLFLAVDVAHQPVQLAPANGKVAIAALPEKRPVLFALALNPVMRQAAGLQLKKNGAETQGVALGWYEPGRWPGKTPSGPLNENGGDVGNDKAW